MGILDGKVAVVTGAGRGLGRSHALALAKEGAAVIVNDPGVSVDGAESAERPAEEVVAEIKAAGGQAAANFADCADWDGGQSMIDDAVSQFGRFDILVNNAGILRDRMSFNMTEEEFDAVVRVHLKGHFVPARHAANYWRGKAKAGEAVTGRIINTTSESAFWGQPGQANYSAAKGGAAAMTRTMARELGAMGVTVNAISPRGRTRFVGNQEKPPEGAFDFMDPEHASPFVAYLASDAAASINGQVFVIFGGYLGLMPAWPPVAEIVREQRWTIEDIPAGLEKLFEGRESVPGDLKAAVMRYLDAPREDA